MRDTLQLHINYNVALALLAKLRFAFGFFGDLLKICVLRNLLVFALVFTFGF